MELRLLWIDIEQWKDNNSEGATCVVVWRKENHLQTERHIGGW